MNPETLTQVLISDLDRKDRLTDFSINPIGCPEKLLDSIKEVGIRHPISICFSNKPYKIISGHKRVQAAIKAGLTSIPAFLFPTMDDALVLNLKENFEDNDFQNWKKRWQERLKTNNNTPEKCIELMRRVNPLVIPRNHKVEEVLNEANKNNLEPINQILQILKNPYIYQKNINEYQVPPASNKKYQTFCGT